MNIYSKLQPDEEILWEGQEQINAVPVQSRAGSIFSFVVWTTILALISFIFYFIKRDFSLLLYIVPFYIIAVLMIYSILKSFLTDTKDISAYYYVTNQRVIIVNSSSTPSFFQIYYENITDFSFDTNAYGIGNLYSSTPIIGSPFHRNNVCLSNVSNVNDVYKLIKSHLDPSQIRSSYEDPFQKSLAEQKTIPFVKEIKIIGNNMSTFLITCILLTIIYFNVVYFVLNNSFTFFFKSLFFLIMVTAIFIYQICFKRKK